MKKSWIIVAIAILVVGIVCLAGYFFLRPAPNVVEGIVVRIPDTKFMGLLPLYVADEKGFFTKHGIKVEWVDVGDPGQAEKAFLAGHADFNITTFASSLQAEIRQPGTLKLFIPVSETIDKPGSYLLLPKDSPITSVDQLRGKKIGTYTGPSQKAYAQIFLSKQGMTAGKDYELIQVASSSQIQALFGGTYDALFTVEPYGSIAIDQGAKVLIDGVRTKYIAQPFWVGAFVVRKDLGENADSMKKIVGALSDAIDYINSNDAASREVLAKRTHTEQKVADRCQLYNWIVNPSDTDIAQMQDLINLLVSEKLLEKNVEIRPLIYQHYDGK